MDLIPAPYRMLALAIALALFGAASGAGGYKLATWHYKPELKAAQEAQGRAEDSLAQYKNAYGALAGAAAEQNTAINALKAEGEARAADAAKRIAAAKATANIVMAQATDIMRSTSPPGLDPCIAAREAFDVELKQERGKP